MKTVWITDPHLNFLPPEKRLEFAQSIADQKPDLTLITGDIAEADSVIPLMEEFAAAVPNDILFVLGNHDFYGSDIVSTREAVRKVFHDGRKCYYVGWGDQVNYVHHPITVVGVDGWYDASCGDPFRLQMSDFQQVLDMRHPTRQMLIERCKEVAAGEVKNFRRALVQAVQHETPEIVVITHVPPFPGACWYEGKRSDPAFLPFFTNTRLGDALIEAAEKYGDKTFTVLCGHTHGEGTYKPVSNLTVYTGPSEYTKPRIAKVMDFSY